MKSELWLANLMAWWLQAGIITMLAALLLRAMRPGSPRATLGYLHVLLSVCLLLPVLEPWRSSPVMSRISARAVSTMRATALGAVPISVPSIVLVLLVIGAGVRVIWLAIGCRRLCRYRRDASPLGVEIATPQERLGVRAEVKVYSEIAVPVTFGLLRPTVLLPARWFDLDSQHRSAVLCHELLHVRRKDWAPHVTEELIRALMWFHPAVWWLVAEIRLAREQVVDQLVVGITGAPKVYAEVLLAFAGADASITAPAFMHKRNLARRLRSILEEVTMTRSRLLFSFASITVCLVIAGAVAVRAFPMESVRSNLVVTGGPDAGVVGGVIRAIPGGVSGGVIGGVSGRVAGGVVGGVPAAAGSRIYRVGGDVSSPKVVSKVDPEYTKEARDAKIEGTVVVQTEIHPDGRAHNTHVLRSLDPGLDHNAMDAISQWQFEPGKKDGQPVAVQATIEVNYKLN